MSLLKQTEKFLDNSKLDDRKKKGQYFTPKVIKDAALDQIDIFDGAKILENSCGTGEFIYSILERNKNVDIDAYDIDPTMVAICQNAFPSINAQVFDFLEMDHKPMYDYVIGASNMIEMGMFNTPQHVQDLRKGLDWFRKNNPSAYMTLLD